MTALLAFGPFSGCGASHRGTREGINPGGPRSPSDPPGSTDTPIDTPIEPPSGGTPEPASLLLAAGAAVGYGVFRLKRKKPEAQNPQA